jgi:hypothetical protein
MASLGQLGQQLFSYDGFNFSVTKVRIQSASDTVVIPKGSQSVSALGPSSDLTASASAGTASDTVTVTGGTAGDVVYVVGRHAGSAGGMGANS